MGMCDYDYEWIFSEIKIIGWALFSKRNMEYAWCCEEMFNPAPAAKQKP